MKFSIAIPNSSLADEKTQVNKTKKISQIARTCAIFQIRTIFIYDESDLFKTDSQFMITVFKYIDTPQFLRRRLFSQINELRYAGITAPLKIPSHNTVNKIRKIKPRDIKDGVVFNYRRKTFIDIGICILRYFGKKSIGSRIQIQFRNNYPNLEYKEIDQNEIDEYWGYDIKTKKNLWNFLHSWKGNIILTSKKGSVASIKQLQKYNERDNELLIVFGTTNKGLHEILGNRIHRIPHSKILNFFPKQKTETVRLEEAIGGVLSILNIFNQ